MTKLTKLNVFLLTSILISLFLYSCNSGIEIQNPYQKVDWKNEQQYKANLHTHTTQNGASMNPNTVVKKYYHLGYSILALTDHNMVTYPWTEFSKMEASKGSKEKVENGQLKPEDLIYENIDPEELNMIAIQGNELSRHHHMGSFFNDHDGSTITEEESLKATAAKNGLTIFNHPGRYKKGVEWYIDLFKRFDHLIGLEAYNSGDRYSNDRIFWDSILVRMMPDRPVWGFSNDDMHNESRLGHNWEVFILPELTSEGVRQGMKEGRFLYTYSPVDPEKSVPPHIKSIEVNQMFATIKIKAEDYDSIRWISGGKIIHRGENIDIKDYPDIPRYIRAEIFGQDSIVVGTQPFGIIRN